jgi:hypothetical protein
MLKVNRLMSVFSLMATLGLVSVAFADRHQTHSTNGFQGPKANTGTAMHMKDGNKSMLRVSDDFKVPDTPAPTWRIVDSKGNIHTLDAFKIKGGEKREINVPAYVQNISKVQVYCAWAETLLGEASFSSPVK